MNKHAEKSPIGNEILRHCLRSQTQKARSWALEKSSGATYALIVENSCGRPKNTAPHVTR